MKNKNEEGWSITRVILAVLAVTPLVGALVYLGMAILEKI